MEEQKEIINNEQSMLDRGKRAIAIRNTLGLSRRKFAKLLNIPFGTLQNWENFRHGGMNEAAAKRLATGLTEFLNVNVNAQWLLHGIGPTPIFPNLIISQSLPAKGQSAKDNPSFLKELQLFRQLHPNSINMIVDDDSMQPVFLKKDYLSAVIIQSTDKIDLDKNFFIVELDNSTCIIRKLQKTQHENQFNLIALEDGKEITTHHNIKPIRIAKIIWIRRL